MRSEQEATFRRAGRIASAVTVALALIALILAIRGDQIPASITLTLALVSLAVTWLSYRRYQSLRDLRWKDEMSGTEAELAQLLADEEDNRISAKSQTRVDQSTEQSEETPLAGQ